ncbi:MAG: Co2+/Mg2+ efflux protein ApaG [Oceanococcus sp.]
MSDTSTQGIRIQVVAEYLPEQSQPQRDRFVFAYHIDIGNHSDHVVQLMDRHWLITNGRGEMEEVRGSGVVGLQPIIHPGEHFRYSSGCPLDTPVGTMEGHYDLKTGDGEIIKARIGVFRLAQPGSLH